MLKKGIENEQSKHEFLFIEYAQVLVRDKSDPENTAKAIEILYGGLADENHPKSENLMLAM